MENSSEAEKGLAYYKEGKYCEALEEFFKVGKEEAANIGNCYYKLGCIGEAVRHWGRVKKRTDLIARRMVDCLIKMKRFDKLLLLKNQLEKANDSSCANLVIYISGMTLWKRDNKVQDALKLLTQVRGIEECSKQMTKLKDEINDTQEKISELEQRVGTAVQKEKLQLAILYYETGEKENITKAVKLLQSIVEENTSESEPYKYFGLCCRALNQREEARGHWANGSICEPKDPEILYLLAEENFELAKDLQMQIDKKVKEGNYSYMKNELDLLESEKQEHITIALGNLEDIQKLSGVFLKMYLLKGDIHESQKQWKDAHYAYSQYLMQSVTEDQAIEKKKEDCFEKLMSEHK